MREREIPISAILFSRSKEPGAYVVLDAIRSHCESLGWDGLQWIGPDEWVLESNEKGAPISCKYVGGEAVFPPPERVRLLYAPYEAWEPRFAQRRAFCRLCFWTLSRGLVCLDEMPTGPEDSFRLGLINARLHELTREAPELGRIWIEPLLSLFLRELSALRKLEDSSTGEGGVFAKDVSWMPEPSGEPIKTQTDVPSIVSKQLEMDTSSSVLNHEHTQRDVYSTRDTSGAPSPIEHTVVPADPCLLLQTVQPSSTEPAPKHEDPGPQWWRTLALRGNPVTAQRVPRNARSGAPIDAIDIRRHLGLESLPEAALFFKGPRPGDHESDGGFVFRECDGVLTGVPTVPGGDYDLVFEVRPPEDMEGSPHLFLIPITVNADPRSLWRTLEPPDNATHRKPHRVGGFKQIDQKITAWASVRGRSHAHDAGHRDDDCIVDQLNENWTLMVVADGAGSARLSRLGSSIAVDAVVRMIRNQFEEPYYLEALEKTAAQLARAQSVESTTGVGGWEVLVKAAFEAQKAIYTKAIELGVDEKVLSTTLLICLARNFESKMVAGAFAVGDGIAASLGSQPSHLRLLSTPDSGEFAGQTKFLTNREIFQPQWQPYSRLKVSVTERPAMVIAMTDGVSDPKFASEKSMADPLCWTELVHELAGPLRKMKLEGDPGSAQALQDWLDFWAVGHHDDRTIAICLDSELLDNYGTSQSTI